MFCACVDRDAEIIEPERFAEIYVEMLLTAIDSTAADSSQFKGRILAEHEVSQKEFEDTMEHYDNNPMLWLDVFTEVNAKLEERLDTEK